MVKKITRSLVLPLMLILMITVCLCLTSCDSNEHTHTFAEDWSSNKTHHYHAATCEHKSEKKDEAEHDWNAGEVTTPATCGAEGVKTFTCTVCNATKTESIQK